MQMHINQIRKLIQEEIQFTIDSLINEKLAKLGTLYKGQSTSGRSSSVTASSVEPTDGVDDCWNTIGDIKKSGCNFDSFTAGGSRNYRSAKPGKNAGSGRTPPDEAVLQHLRDKWGIKRIIDLTDDSREEALAKKLDMDYVANKGAGYGKPTDAAWGEMKTFLSQGDTLIHCTYGADRTGGFVGRAKIELGNEDPEKVRDEAVDVYGMDACPDNSRLHAWLGLPCEK